MEKRERGAKYIRAIKEGVVKEWKGVIVKHRT